MGDWGAGGGKFPGDKGESSLGTTLGKAGCDLQATLHKGGNWGAWVTVPSLQDEQRPHYVMSLHGRGGHSRAQPTSLHVVRDQAQYFPAGPPASAPHPNGGCA